MKTAKFLFWLGIIVMVVQLAANVYSAGKALQIHMLILDLNISNLIVITFGSLYQGALLIGVSKILEKLHDK